MRFVCLRHRIAACLRLVEAIGHTHFEQRWFRRIAGAVRSGLPDAIFRPDTSCTPSALPLRRRRHRAAAMPEHMPLLLDGSPRSAHFLFSCGCRPFGLELLLIVPRRHLSNASSKDDFIPAASFKRLRPNGYVLSFQAAGIEIRHGHPLAQLC